MIERDGKVEERGREREPVKGSERESKVGASEHPHPPAEGGRRVDALLRLNEHIGSSPPRTHPSFIIPPSPGAQRPRSSPSSRFAFEDGKRSGFENPPQPQEMN